MNNCACKECDFRGALRWYIDRQLIYCMRYKEWIDIKKTPANCKEK